MLGPSPEIWFCSCGTQPVKQAALKRVAVAILAGRIDSKLRIVETSNY
jgi:hypothetical protein